MNRLIASLLAVAGLCAGAANAQNYPTRPVTLIVPFAAGGPTDIVAKVNDALVKALDDEGTRKRLLALGGVILEKSARTPESLGNVVKSEIARWTTFLKAAGVTAN